MIKKKMVPEIVDEILAPLFLEQGIELVDVEYKKESQNWVIRVFIDKPEGVQHKDCQEVSEYLSKHMDILDVITHNYNLEVSSPGIERPLKKPQDFSRFKGSKVIIKTFQPVDGRKKIEGKLIDFVDEQVFIETDMGEIIIPYNLVAQARLKVF